MYSRGDHLLVLSELFIRGTHDDDVKETATSVPNVPLPWLLFRVKQVIRTVLLHRLNRKKDRVVFDKPNGIAEQLAATTKSRNGGGGSRGLNNKQIPDETEEDEEGDDEDDEGQFDKLRAFYQSQLSKSTPQTAGGSTVDIHAGGNGGSYRYGSPGTLARLVNLYTGAGNQLQRTSKDHNGLMREANNIEEGLKIIGKNNEEVVIEKMKRAKWDDSKVVILCPQFEVGPNRDVWEEALGTGPDNGGRGTAITGGGSSSSNRQKETDRERNGGKSGMGLISTTSSSSITTLGGGGGGGGGGGAAKEEMMGPEAGKIWERGANWTTVVVEVTPFLAPSSSSSSEEEERGESTSANAAGGNGTTASDGGTITPAAVVEGGVTTTTTKAAEGNNDDSDSSDSSSDNDNENDVGNKLLEIPIFIRIEYETTTSSTTTASTTVAATGSSHVGKNHLKKSGLSKNHDFNHDNDDGHEDGEEEVGGEGRGVSGGKGGEGRENREMAYWIVTGVGIIQ
ncbi:MAG: hypothetical protein M1823_004946 [Watsoniomyces obsoletus]|nr:MAG: hypothetical protein M1823_004946 [Watsoniomyces obsoletus]